MLYLKSTRLSFLRPTEADLPYIKNLLATRALTGHPGELPDGRQVDEVARGIVTHWRSHPYGTCLIQLSSSGVFIGLGGIKDLVIEGKALPDLGFMFLSEYQHQGLGYEAAEAVIAHGFSAHNLDRIVANTTDNNQAALSLLTKLGFRFVRKVTYESGGVMHRDSLMYEITRDAYAARKAIGPRK